MKSRFIWIVVLLAVFAVFFWLVALKEDPSMENAEKIASQWIVEESLTYVYDGFDLELVKAEKIEDSTYRFKYDFTSRHGGYGNRSDQVVTQVLSDHTMIVIVKDGKISYAATDQHFDEVTGGILPDRAF